MSEYQAWPMLLNIVYGNGGLGFERWNGRLENREAGLSEDDCSMRHVRSFIDA